MPLVSLSQSPQGERCTGQKVSLYTLPCWRALPSGARQSQHAGIQEQVPLHRCDTGSTVGLCSCAGTTTRRLLLTRISTTVPVPCCPVPWAMCSAVAKLLPVQLPGSAQQNTFCWGPQFPSRTLKKSPSVFYKSCGHLSSSLNAPTRDCRQLLACPSSASLFLWLSGPHATFKHL